MSEAESRTPARPSAPRPVEVLLGELRRTVEVQVEQALDQPLEPYPAADYGRLRRRLGPSAQVNARHGRASLVVIFQPAGPVLLAAADLLVALMQAHLDERVEFAVDRRLDRVLVRATGREPSAGLDRAAAALVETLAGLLEAAAAALGEAAGGER